MVQFGEIFKKQDFQDSSSPVLDKQHLGAEKVKAWRQPDNFSGNLHPFW